MFRGEVDSKPGPLETKGSGTPNVQNQTSSKALPPARESRRTRPWRVAPFGSGHQEILRVALPAIDCCHLPTKNQPPKLKGESFMWCKRSLGGNDRTKKFTSKTIIGSHRIRQAKINPSPLMLMPAPAAINIARQSATAACTQE